MSGAANTFIDHSRRFHSGYAVGGGGEVLVTPRLSLKVEYLYLDLGSQTHSFAIAGHSSKTIDPGSSARLTVKRKPGRYPYKCTVDSHAELGMKGVLRVRS